MSKGMKTIIMILMLTLTSQAYSQCDTSVSTYQVINYVVSDSVRIFQPDTLYPAEIVLISRTGTLYVERGIVKIKPRTGLYSEPEPVRYYIKKRGKLREVDREHVWEYRIRRNR